MTMDDG